MENDRKVEHAWESSPETAEAIKNAQPSSEAEKLNYLLEDLPSETLEAIKTSKMDPKHDHLNALMDETPPEQVVIDQTVTSGTTINELDPNSTTNPQGTRAPGQLSVTEMLQYELAQHARIALEYKNLIKTAKTEPKKNYYKKKLTKNNENALKILVALDRITTSRARKNVKPEQSK